MMENRTGEKRNMSNVDFDSIRVWISEYLKTPNEIVHSEGRNVIINTEAGPKYIEIPRLTEFNKEEWKKAWFDVYESCLSALDTLQLKVNRIYSIGKKEGYVSQTGTNEIKVGTNIISIPTDYNSVAYAKALEKIIIAYNMVKIAEKKAITKKPIAVSHTTIKIENPDEILSRMRTNINVIPTVKPVTEPVQTTVKAQTPLDEDRVNSVRMTLQQSKPVEKVTNYKQVQIHKIPDDVCIDKEDKDIYRDKAFVIATCTSVKHGDGVFRDNIDLLKDMLPSISIGSFISGKAYNSDQVAKEGGKILKLLNDCDVNKLVIYEINNDYVNEHLNKPEMINEILNASNQMCNILTDSNYYPVLCMDFDTFENIKNIIPHYTSRYPILKCVTPKQKDLVQGTDDILYMNPSSDTDVIMISNSVIQTNLERVTEEVVRESYSRQTA